MNFEGYDLREGLVDVNYWKWIFVRAVHRVECHVDEQSCRIHHLNAQFFVFGAEFLAFDTKFLVLNTKSSSVLLTRPVLRVICNDTCDLRGLERARIDPVDLRGRGADWGLAGVVQRGGVAVVACNHSRGLSIAGMYIQSRQHLTRTCVAPVGLRAIEVALISPQFLNFTPKIEGIRGKFHISITFSIGISGSVRTFTI